MTTRDEGRRWGSIFVATSLLVAKLNELEKDFTIFSIVGCNNPQYHEKDMWYVEKHGFMIVYYEEEE